MQTLLQQVEETIAYIGSKTAYRPETAIVLGSGLGQLADRLEDGCSIAYEELPHWKSSTAPGHNGRLLFGRLGGKPVVCMQGRLHYYEGYSMAEITYPVRVMARLGVKNLLLSNAAGGINLDFAPGDLMLITDHINFLGRNPLMGPNALLRYELCLSSGVAAACAGSGCGAGATFAAGRLCGGYRPQL